MEYDFEDPNFDFAGNAEIIAQRLRRAREMQNVEAPNGVSAPGVFAMSRPDIGGAIQRGVGRYEQAQAEQARGSMNTEQLRRYDELSRGLNEMKPIDYSNPDEAVLENSRKQALAAQMAKLNLPQAQKAAEIYLNKGAAFPETIAKMKMEQIERGEQNALKLAEIEAQKRRDEEFKRWQTTQQDDTKRFVAGLTASSRENKPDMRFVDTVDADGNPVKQVVDMSTVKPGDTFGKPPAKGASAQKEKALTATTTLLDTVNLGLGLVDKSSGAYSVIPQAIRQHFTDPATKVADAVIGKLSAEEAHTLYGAAFTGVEMGRANQFLPSNSDTNETKRWKMEQMKILLEKKQAMLNGKPDPYPDLHKDILEPLMKGESPVARTAGAGTQQTSGKIGSTGGGAKASSADTASFEAYYNSLAPGTRYITPDGRPKIKGQK